MFEWDWSKGCTKAKKVREISNILFLQIYELWASFSQCDSILALHAFHIRRNQFVNVRNDKMLLKVFKVVKMFSITWAHTLISTEMLCIPKSNSVIYGFSWHQDELHPPHLHLLLSHLCFWRGGRDKDFLSNVLKSLSSLWVYTMMHMIYVNFT